MPTISEECVGKIEELAKTDISDVVLYWYMKRKIRCGVPLIKRLMVGSTFYKTISKPFILFLSYKVNVKASYETDEFL